jgi:hypothetical protein
VGFLGLGERLSGSTQLKQIPKPKFRVRYDPAGIVIILPSRKK